MRWRLRLSEYTLGIVYQSGASHHLPDFLSRASTVAPPEDIHDDTPCHALPKTANGLRTGRYTSTDTPEPVEFEGAVRQSADRLDSVLVSQIQVTAAGQVRPSRWFGTTVRHLKGVNSI